MTDKAIEDAVKQLFSHDSDAVRPTEEGNALRQQADSLVRTNGWDAVLQALIKYLHTCCRTPESITNAANWIWNYGWYEHPVPDPYGFLGYLYYRAGFLKASYDARCILDGLTTEILPAQGYQEANIYYHPYYAAETDPKMIAAVNRWKERLSRDEPANTD